MKKSKDNLFTKEEKMLRREWKNIIFNFVVATVALLITVFFYKDILLTTFLLLVVSVIGLIKWRSWLAIGIFLFIGISGPIAENFAIIHGVWQYSLPNIMNIPIWLFVLWGIAGAFIFEMAKELKKLGVKDGR